MEEFNFLNEIEEELDKQFPKGECKERGNALVLFAMVNIKFKKFIKKLEDINIPIQCRIAMEKASEKQENESGDDILTFDKIEDIVLKVYNREIKKLSGDKL